MPVTALPVSIRKANKKTSNKAYYDSHRESIIANQRRIYQENKEVIKRKRRERYARQKAAKFLLQKKSK